MSGTSQAGSAAKSLDTRGGHHLPIELHALIIKYLPVASLAVFARVSITYHHLATSLLYRELTIDLNHKRHPFSSLPFVDDTDERPPAPLAPAPETDSSPTRSYIESYNRFDHTTNLTILSHRSIHCCYQAPAMPNLTHLHLLHDTRFCSAPSGAEPERVFRACRLIQNLRPRHLSLGNASSSFAYTAPGLFSPFPPPWLKELVIFLGDGCLTTNGYTNTNLDDLSGSLDKVSLVFQPTGDVWSPRPRGYSISYLMSRPELVDRLAVMSSGRAGRVEIVGLEMINEYWSECSAESMEQMIKEVIAGRMWSVNRRKQDEMQRRITEEVVFMSRAEYDLRDRVAARS